MLAGLTACGASPWKASLAACWFGLGTRTRCAWFFSSTCSELHYYFMRSFHSWQPLELEEGFVRRTGPLPVAVIRSWGGFLCCLLAGWPRTAPFPSAFPTLTGGRSGGGGTLGFAELAGRDGTWWWRRAQVGWDGCKHLLQESSAEGSGAGAPFLRAPGWLSRSTSPAFPTPSSSSSASASPAQPASAVELVALLRPPPHLHHLTGLTRFP